MEAAGLSRHSTNSVHPTISALIDLTAGALGGTANVLVGQPLDTVKVKMQSFPHLYGSSWPCFRETLTKEGVKGLYAGTMPALLANVAENSVLFCAYGVCQKAVQVTISARSISELSPLANASAGFLAAFFSSLVLCPTELIKCKLQAMREMGNINSNPEGSGTHKRIGPWGVTREVLRKDGVRGLFCGLTPTFAREMPGYFFFFGGYEYTRGLLTPPGKTKEEIGMWIERNAKEMSNAVFILPPVPRPLRTIVAGGVGGLALWTSIFPADVIKSRMQISGVEGNMLKMMKDIVRIEGIGALYNGLGPTLLRTFPSTGALFLAYETTKKLLNDLAE